MKSGVVIGGRYRLVEPLASGGMGTVWRARHTELDVDVAVKLMSDALSRAPTALARFQREAKAAAQLRSPHVVQVFDYGVDAAQPYLAMELLEGVDLRTHLARVGAMPLEHAARVVDALAKALRLAHAAGIVHRDLKPANVFLQRSDGDEVVKILDFGIAKDLGPKTDGLQTSTSNVVGSPLYMSPEQVRGAEVDHRTDVWSLAVITFEMITGRQPFEGVSLGDVFARIVADEIPKATTVATWLPPSIDRFFERALARPVAKRFASATDLAEAFREVIGAAPPREAAASAPHAPRVAVDAPTLDASAPALQGSAAFAPAHTSATSGAGAEPIELARTVATPTPAVRVTPSEAPAPRGSGRAIAALAVIGLGVGIAVFALRSPTVVPPSDGVVLADAQRTPTTSAPTPAGGPSASPQVQVVDAAPSSAGTAPPPSASASADAAAPSATPTVTPKGPAGPSPSGRPRPPPSGGGAQRPPMTDPIFGVPVPHR